MSERAGNTDFEDFNPWSRFGNKKKKLKLNIDSMW